MAEPRAIKAPAPPADGPFTRQSRCKVNERVDVIDAVHVKVLVNVIVEDQVEDLRDRLPSSWIATTSPLRYKICEANRSRISARSGWSGAAFAPRHPAAEEPSCARGSTPEVCAPSIPVP